MGRNDPPIVVTYWWGGKNKLCMNSKYDYFNKRKLTPKSYEKISEMFKNNVTRVAKLECYHEHISPSTYQDGISYKPKFIRRMLNVYKRPVIYMDIDMKFHARPSLFIDTKGYYDFMAFNWNSEPRMRGDVFDWKTLETSGGLFYFNNTSISHELLKDWEKRVQLNPNKADDRILSMVFLENDYIKRMKCYWFPIEYYYLPEHYKINKKDVVISHPYKLSDETEILNCMKIKSRNPRNYDKIIEKYFSAFPIVLETKVTHPIIRKITLNRNKHIFVPMITKYVHKNDKLKKYDIFYISCQ